MQGVLCRDAETLERVRWGCRDYGMDNELIMTMRGERPHTLMGQCEGQVEASGW